MKNKSVDLRSALNVVITIMILLWTALYAQENECVGKNINVGVDQKNFAQCQTKIKDGMTSMAYIRVKPKRILKKTSYKNSISFIRNIKAKVSNTDVLNISFGDPINFKYKGVRFNFEDFSPYAQKIEYEIIDNHDKKVKKSCEIFRENMISKKHLYPEVTNVLSNGVDQKVWTATTIKEVIQLLYGVDKTEQMKKSEVGNSIQLMCSNKSLNAMPKSLWYEEQCLKSVNYKTGIKILSSKDLESVALLYTGNKFPLIFFAKFSNYSRLPLKVLTRFYKEGTLMLLAKDKNGKLYYSKSYFLNTRTANDLDDGTRLDFYIK
ncbi:hypothetical protein [Sulfurovum sp. AR]|uniref:hypothetical protein n=1 Tax=Sulfurovum sp. AR TaxID=1165841 RepID=UPI00025C47EC|nr:hypothetical protein [Sulfurovum sp. AR]EIF50431.1 hypothetical protein SULAR_08112 [Sulfurovum sp. AR]